jgi:hypothetical protein
MVSSRANRHGRGALRDNLAVNTPIIAKIFVKQIDSNHALWPSVTGKGEDPAQWRADLRVQDFPQ